MSLRNQILDCPTQPVVVANRRQRVHLDSDRRGDLSPTPSEKVNQSREPQKGTPRHQRSQIGQHAPFRILFVNHDRLFRKFALQSLRLPDFNVCAISTTDEALSAIIRANKTKFHMMILNQELPGMQSSEMVQRCRLASPRLPVLLVGATMSNELKDACREAAADNCLAIPCEAKDLIAAVHALLP